MLIFHRRLITLAFIFIGICALLSYQAVQLTIVQGSQLLEEAKSRLYNTQYLPTWRGRIIDSKGRVIAEDEASYDVAIAWDIITGQQAKNAALQNARTNVGREKWQAMLPDEKQQIVNVYLPKQLEELDNFLELISKTAKVPRSELDERMATVQKKVQKTIDAVGRSQRKAHRKLYGDVKYKQQPIAEERSFHVVVFAIDDETAMEFSRLTKHLDHAIEVQHARNRQYPQKKQTVFVNRSTLPRYLRASTVEEVVLPSVGDLLLGNIRSKVWAEDMERRPFNHENDLGGYRTGDEVGNRGLELSLENKLRGLRGRVIRDRFTKEVERTSATGGSDVQLTLDIALQAKIEAILSPQVGLMTVQTWHRNKALEVGTPLRGAVVVLDANSGVLAMASTPALPNVEDVEGYPWLNRAADGLYPAGSIVKPLVLAAASSEGLYPEDQEIECTGHYFEHEKNVARCWIYREGYDFKTHGKLKAVEALARSCNIFFYKLGTRLGFDRLLGWYQKFGLTQPLSAKLTNSSASGSQGHTPKQENIVRWKKRGELEFETISMAIGQGFITWSPLHAASSYATLARGGIWKSPTILQDGEQEVSDIELNPIGVRLAMAGLHDSLAKEYGTGAFLRYGANDREPIFNVNGVRLWGKTGTAQAPAYKKPDGSVIPGLDHSWFLVMASHKNETKPGVIVAVLIEYGGSGGRIAGPIANQVIHALQDEGYLEEIQ